MNNRYDVHARCPFPDSCEYIDIAIKIAEDCIGINIGTGDVYLLVQQLEELKELHDDLRRWGCEEAELVDTLQEEVAKLKKDINTLTM